MSKPKKHKLQKTSRSQKVSRTFTFFTSRNIAKILIILGISFVIIPFFFYLNQSIQLSLFSPKIQQPRTLSTRPVPTAIRIPSVHLNLPVEETQIKNGVWEIAKSVSYLGTSARPGEKGALIFYAHNTNERFGPIRWLPLGSLISITTADGKQYDYKVSQTLEVSANDIAIFEQKNETLILYTCTGFADLKRYIVLATPLSSPDRLEATF